MEQSPNDFLTTKELADLLRIKERKVYDLAAAGDVPCVRVVGKLLFPRQEIENWISAAHSGPGTPDAPLPSIVAGSHDPLLDWALRESGCQLAAFFDGSHDGLTRIGARTAMAAGIHIHEGSGWNIGAVSAALGQNPVVLVEFARRQRGIIHAPTLSGNISGIADLHGLRFAHRQTSAASQTLFEDLAQKAGIDPTTLDGPENPARTEDDVARMVQDGHADTAFGLASVARQFGLGFVPVVQERFDLLVWRQAWFEPPIQKLINFARSDSFAARAAEMTGYDISGLGTVRFNGP